jgi:hypothetical protein
VLPQCMLCINQLRAIFWFDSIFSFVELVSFKKSVVNIGIKLYNKLPSHMKKIEKMKHFKRELISFLLQHTFYFIDEYMHH